MTPEQLQTIIISLASWSAITTILLLLAKRDVKLGLKKWFYAKTGRQPIKIRYHGPDQNIIENIVPLKGKGELVTLFDKRLFMKTGKGSTFIIEPKAIRRTDDGINEISFSYKSVMPTDPTMNAQEVEDERKEFMRPLRPRAKEPQANGEPAEPIDMDELVRHTDPKRLNKTIDYIYLAAKADALAAATEVEKWVKFTFFAAAAAAIIGVVIYYNLDAKLLPIMEQVRSSVTSLGTTVLNL